MAQMKEHVKKHICFISRLKKSTGMHVYLLVVSSTKNLFSPNVRGCPRGVMVKAMDCGIVVSEFELQSRYYVHFNANTLVKGMNSIILLAMG